MPLWCCWPSVVFCGLQASSLPSLFPVSHGLLLRVSLCVSSLLIRASVIIKQGSRLLQYDLILTYILIISAKTLFANEVTIHRY